MKNSIIKFSVFSIILLLIYSCNIFKDGIDIEKITKSCEHNLSLFNSSTSSQFKAIKVSSIGNTKIKLASVGNDYTQTQNYPNWVQWDIQSSPTIPQGFPLSGDFKIYVGEESVANQKVKVEWLGLNNEVLCVQEIEVTCQNQSAVIYSDNEFKDKIEKLVHFDGEFLVFKNRPAFKNVYNYLSDASVEWEQKREKVVDSLSNEPFLSYFESNFQDYISLRKEIEKSEREMEKNLFKKDKEPKKSEYDAIYNGFIDDELNTLLNKNKAYKVGKDIWVFKNNQTTLFQIPNVKNQKDIYLNIIKQDVVTKIDNSVIMYDLENGATIRDNFQSVNTTKNPYENFNRSGKNEKCDSTFVVSGYEPVNLVSKSSGCWNDFTYQRTGCLEYTFINNSSVNNTNTSFTWYLKQGTSQTIIGTTSGTNQNFTYTFPSDGIFTIALTSDCIEDGESSGFFTDFIEISQPESDFEYTQRECSLTFDFQEDVPSSTAISSYKWNIFKNTTIIHTSTNHTTSFTFQNNGTYKVCLEVTDNFGCISKECRNIEVSDKLQIDPKMDYNFCCDDKDYSDVTLNPIVTGGICPLKYDWDFGDGSPNSNLKNPTHRYGCGQKYIATLTVEDANGKTVKETFKIVQCETELKQGRKCPNGRVSFYTDNGCVYSKFIYLPSNVDPSRPKTWHSAGADRTSIFNTNRKSIFWYTTAGSYNVWALTKSKCSPAGCNECRLTLPKDITITSSNCCAKNDREWNHKGFTHNGKNYRAKIKFNQLSMPMFLITRVKVKTTLSKKGFLGFYYRTKADLIKADWSGTVYRADGNWWQVNIARTHCNCVTPDNKSGSDSRVNSSKAKVRTGIHGNFATRVNSITSTHYVKIGNTIIDGSQMQLTLGNDCDWNN